MSTERKQQGGWVAGALPGCRRCSAAVPKGRRTFCSKDCVHEWKLRTNPGYLRLKVFERDNGICAACRADVFSGVTWRWRAKGSGDLWQADHITPVIEGGGECGIDNVRTLCTACHKKATAELRGRMAQARRATSEATA